MASLLRLPPELSLQVFGYLGFGDKVRLSATCKEYRLHLAPDLFATIRFTNEEDIAQSALAAVKAHGKHTTRIEFTPSASGDEEFASPALVPAASEVLRGRRTPHARAAQIHFDFDFDGHDGWDDAHSRSIYVFEDEEDGADIEAREQKHYWRALMRETWEALSANPHVADLGVQQLVPKSTSAFLTEAFADFLGRLESAALTIWGTDNGVGWKSNTVSGYVEWLGDDLGGAFFRHMTHLKHLAIHASRCGPLGCEGVRHIPLALEPGDLPALESLTLANCYVGLELVAFVREHAAVLQRLDLDDCVSPGADSYTTVHPTSWAEFFDRLYEARPSALAALAAGGADAPLFEAWDGDADGAEAAEAREVRRRLREEPGRKLFAYCYQDSKYGMCLSLRDENREAFLRGDDQRAYDRLMGLVGQNAARARRGLARSNSNAHDKPSPVDEERCHLN